MNRRTAIVLTVMLVSTSLASAQIGYIYTYAGNDVTGSFPGNGGQATNARVTNPAGLAIDNVGNLYIAASGNSLIRKVDANTGIITTVAGGGTGGDGGLATDAQLTSPCDVKLDPWNNLYISETCVTATSGDGGGGGTGTGGAARIRRVDATTGIITTIAGGTSSGFAGDGGPATSALLNLPAGLAIDGAGNVFVADSGNHRIRRIDRGNGFITTVAGNGVATFAGDGGPATLASLNTPAGLTVDASGNLYIAEAGNNVIRRVDGVTGIITTVAGTGATTFNGDGIAATAANLNGPASVILNSGNLIFTELGNSRVRTIDNAGLIWTLAGDGTSTASGGQIGDGASASLAVLTGPFGLAARPFEPMFISELTGDRVREENNGPSVPTAVTVSASSSTAGPGAPVTLTATVVASNGQGSSAPGGVYFFDGTNMIGAGGMNNGSASMTTSSLALGVHNITGQYIGSSSFGGSVSPVFTLTVSANTPFVSLNASPNPAVANQPVTLTAFVTPSPATGTVTFYNGATAVGAAFLSGGVATRSVPGFAAGTYSLSAQYGGDSTYTSAGSSAVSLNVKTNPSIVVTSGLNPSTPGQEITFTATITPATASGTVQFFDGGTPFGGTPTIGSGTALAQISTLAAGPHSITASYAGDANNGPAVSPTFTQTVNKIATTATATSSIYQATMGFPITLSATVSPATATGTVQFLDGATTVGSGTLNGGTAFLFTNTLPAGVHSITVVYGGDAVNAGSTSAAIMVTIQGLTTVTLASNQNPVPVGAPVILTSTVSPAGATGTVQFWDNTILLGTATIASGVASFTTTTLAQGTHPIQADYSGDTTNSSSYSSVLLERVKLTTGLSLTSSLNPSVTGQSVTFNATVNPAATGTIQFLDGATVLATVTVISGAAAYSTSSLTQGAHGISVIYSGDANYLSSQSAAMTQTVNAPAATVTSVTSTQNPAFAGAPVTFLASVSPATATGTVQFLDGATVLSTVALASGSASFSTLALAAGAHSITVVYSGDAVDSGSTSAVVTQTINAKANTVSSVTSTQNPATVGAAVTFTASVSPATATGTVQFLDGASVLGTGTLAGGSVSFSTSTLAVGAHSITAVYGGDAGDNGSTSAVFTQTIKANTTTSVTSTQNPAAAGAAVTFTASVTPATATGNVQFLDGATVLGTGALASGSVSFSTSSLAAGAHSITAVYGGDAADNGSTSAVLTQTVNPKANTVISVTSAQNPSTAGASVTFTATVSPSTATGTVQFLDGATVLGTAAIMGGSASFSTSALAGGTHAITAVYSGDAANATSTSAVVTQTVKLNTALSLQSGLNPSVVGQAVTFTATVAASGTASGTVQFLDGGTVLGTVTLSSNVAQFSTASLSQGAHSMSAVYSGDSNYTGSNGSLAQTVNPKTATTTVLGSSWNPAIVSGGTVTFTADVSPMSSTGTVQFLDGATVLGTRTLVNGEATFGSSTLSLGTHSITAMYSGNATTLGSTSAVLTQSVKQLPGLNPTITPSPTAVAGHPVTLKATMNTAATGTVTFTDGATVLASVPVSAGSASYTTSTLAPGVHSLGISYGGDGTFISAGANVNETILAASTLLLSSSVNPGTAGQSITFSANVTPASATGTVQFFDGATLLGTSSVSAGLAQLATSALAKGSHSVTATYGGDPADAAATSNALVEVVRAASTISLTSNANPSLVNQAVKFTATISPSVATGTVQFLDGFTVLSTVTVSGGAANFTTTQLAAGAHSVTAIYGGDSNDAPVTSAALSQTVNLPPPSAPGGLNASASGPDQVNLSWNASPTSGVTYNVYMSTSSGFTPSASNRIATGVPSTAYSATGLASATQYHFRVTAADAGGESAATSQANATTAGEFACHVVYNTSNQTGSTFSGTISIQNTGTLSVNSWSLTWTWAGDQQITQSSNSHFTQSGKNVTLTNTGNGRINAGSAVNGIGFNANYSGTNTAPTAFSVNGTACQ